MKCKGACRDGGIKGLISMLYCGLNVTNLPLLLSQVLAYYSKGILAANARLFVFTPLRFSIAMCIRFFSIPNIRIFSILACSYAPLFDLLL